MPNRILDHILKPFEPLLANPKTTDIVVNRPQEIGVKANGEWSWHEAPSLTFDVLSSIAILTAYQTRQDIDDERPLCSTTFPGGERLQICRPPVSAPDTISMSIRRPPDFKPTLANSAFERAEVTGRTALDDVFGADADMLRAAVLSYKNIVISGAVGTRKTTVTKALIDAIPREQRIITIEDVPEWNNVPHRNRVGLYYSKGMQGSSKVGADDLIEASLRMIPDRILIQELRDGAAYAYVRALLPHPGGITSIHARSPASAFDALRLMIKQHPTGATLGDEDIRQQLRDLIDVIVQMHPEQRGNTYRITEIYVRPQS